MRLQGIWLLALVPVALVSGPAAQSPTPPLAAPGFNDDVAPILFRHCASCHRPGQMAPMSLLTYEDARPWARAIQKQVAARAMPPWGADPRTGQFSNDPSLPDADVAVITRWVEAGAPRGSSPAPAPPVFADGWQIGTPDLVLAIPKPFPIPATGLVEYQYFEIPTGLTEDRWLEAVEIRPGNRKAVHHALAFVRTPGTPAPRLTPHGDGTSCNEDACGDIERHDERMGPILAASAAGTQPEAYPPGTAKLLRAGSIVTLQVHYTPYGEETSDRIAIGFVFAKAPPAVPLKMVPMSKQGFTIPPRAAGHAVETSLVFAEDVAIWSIGPHAHLRGRSWRYEIVHPDGRTTPLLVVPRFDFNWQLVYRFARPITLPRGSRLHAVAVFDNSAGNPANPDPDAEVRWGTMTTDEMMFSSIVYSAVAR
jgi:hypothetical protein